MWRVEPNLYGVLMLKITDSCDLFVVQVPQRLARTGIICAHEAIWRVSCSCIAIWWVILHEHGGVQ